ncbi:MAG: glycosyl hydrolase 53 family protein [Cyclobacteriaceae bacterium]
MNKGSVIIFSFLFHLMCISDTISALDFYVGADLSYVNELEDCGVIYKDQTGELTDPYQIFADEGANVIRLRLWHNPEWTNYSNLEDVRKSIKRSKDAGMTVLLDFHYSDFWADPGRNWRPQAWEAIDDDQILGDSLYDYTFQVLKSLDEEGLLPEMVQIGNETNGNILIKRENADIAGTTPGLYPIDWNRQSMLFNRALEAVVDIETLTQQELKTVIHVANPGSATSWFDAAFAFDLKDFDIIGLSYYPQWHEIDIRGVGDYVRDLRERFSKEIMIVEVGYPWNTSGIGDNAGNVLGTSSRMNTRSAFSEEEQRDFLIELTWLVKENGGLGVIYWEPAWVSSSCQTYWGTGSHYENATFFDYDNTLHEGGIRYLSYDYSHMPEGLQEQIIVFKVNMKHIDTQNGVFITGDFTGEDWQFVEMQNEESDVYFTEVQIPGRTEGAFAFYKDDQWSNQAIEQVPEFCAVNWGSHRNYAIKNTSRTYEYAWSSCNSQLVAQPLHFPNDVPKSLIYPNPANDFVTIDVAEEVVAVKLFHISGKELTLPKSNGETICIEGFKSGVYFLEIIFPSGSQRVKLLKQ